MPSVLTDQQESMLLDLKDSIIDGIGVVGSVGGDKWSSWNHNTINLVCIAFVHNSDLNYHHKQARTSHTIH